VDSLGSTLSRNFSVPGYAGGGFVQAAGSGGGFTLVLGNERFDLSAADETLSRLEKAAMRRRLTSGGRKASHFA
jgi:hypothetical protein